MIKVISVGNITMGGTGKTPHTALLASEFTELGKIVTILSRGYKGLLGGETNVISDGESIKHTPPESADEPYMLARQCKGVSVITGVDRVASLHYAEKHFNSNLAILDDGYQYHRIKKDVEILLLDATNPISTGFPFPFGYLREFPSAIKRADIVIFTRSTNRTIPDKVKRFLKTNSIYFSNYKFNEIINEEGILSTEKLRGKKVSAFSSIANNKSFQNSLLKEGLDVVHFEGFADHKLLSEKTLNSILNKGIAKGATEFITTEKDYVKLSATFQRIFSYLKINIEVNEKDKLIRDISDRLKI